LGAPDAAAQAPQKAPQKPLEAAVESVPARPGVCLVSSSYPSPTAPTRGAFVEDIALGLAAGGPVAVVAPLIYSDDPVAEARKGIPVTRFAFGSKGRLLKEYGGTPPWLMLRYLAAGLMATLRAARPMGCVFAHWVVPAGVIGAAASVLAGRPLVLYAHGSDICVYAERSGAYRALTRWVLGRARHVFAASRDIEGRLTGRLGVPPERVSVVPCGVDTAIFRPAPDPGNDPVEDPAPPGPVRLLFVGDMVPPKGVPELVTAVLGLRAKGAALVLDLVGDGPLRPELEARVAEAGQGDGLRGTIRFWGTLPRPAVADRMRAAHALVLPSHNEGTPVSVMEALTCGVPVVASRVGGIPDLVADGEDGLLVPPKDPDALAAALARLSEEPGLLSRLARGAAATGGRFSLDDRRREVAGVLDRVLGGAPAGTGERRA
jgi:glycosyltransferase involved in cell wall biosynthesis